MTGHFKIVNARTEYVVFKGRFVSKDDLGIKGFLSLERYRKKNPRCTYAIDIIVDEDVEKIDPFIEMDIYNQQPFFFK